MASWLRTGAESAADMVVSVGRGSKMNAEESNFGRVRRDL